MKKITFLADLFLSVVQLMQITIYVGYKIEMIPLSKEINATLDSVLNLL